jgi:hypothetical protein
VPFLDWLQNNAVISWIHSSDSLFGYTLYLSLHTIGMVFLVGPSLLIAARVLGLAPDLPLKPLAAFRPVMTIGFWITLITGTVLFATDGERYLHNGVFIAKIVSLIVALFCLRALLRELFDRAGTPQAASPRVRTLTITLMLMWTIGVVAGRLTAYSGVVVFAAVMAFLTLIAIVAVAAYVARLVSRHRRPQVAAAPTASLRIDVHPTAVEEGK